MAVSATLGILYSIYNTDLHHWGLIAGTVLDYIHGLRFFSEIYIQYGIGESLLFNFLNHFFPINYTSIGIATSIGYALNLLVIYLSLRKLTSTTLATLLIAIIFLLHPYAIYPWPDYWAGLSLSLACYFLIDDKESKGSGHFALAGAFLFAAFIFRNTYLLSIIAASLAYCVFSVFNKKVRNKNTYISIFVFFGLIGIYLLWLMSNHTLSPWYEQSLGAASSQYRIGMSHILLLLKRVFLPAKFYLPNNQVTTTISALIYISIYTLYLLLFKTSNGTAVFLTLLGLSGIVQATLGYEIFRIQNACSPLYLVFAVFIAMKLPNINAQLKQRKQQFIIGFYVVLLLVKFPHSSSLFPLYDGELHSYSESKAPFFRWHRFRADEKKYFDDLYLYMCDGHKKIVNRTMDSTIPYLCPNQSNAHGLPYYYPTMISMIVPGKIEAEDRGEFNEDEVVVAELPVEGLFLKPNPSVKLIEIGKANRPASTRFFGENTVSVFRVEGQKQ